MKTVSATLTALVVLGFAAAASAQCAGYSKSTTAQVETPVVVTDGSVGS